MRLARALFLAMSLLVVSASVISDAGKPILLGLDAEFGHRTSTSAEAIRRGMEIAIAEINAAGGLLGGRPLELVVRDNRSITARGVDNLRELAALPESARLPIVSHWGITGGDFVGMTGPALSQVRLAVVQTYSFIGRTDPIARRVVAALQARYGVSAPAAIESPAGVAHAYDLTHLLALAVERAGTTERARVRDALEHLGPYQGLVKHYPRPFTPERHDALSPEDVFMAHYTEDGRLIPAAD